MTERLAAGQLGAPGWLGEAILVAGLALAAFLLLRVVVRRAVAPLARALAWLLAALVGVVGVVLLAAEYLCTRALRRLRLRPPGITYAYGALVRQVAVSSRAELAALGGRAAAARRAPGWLLLLLVGAALVGWNQTHCASGSGRGCQRPAAVWYRSMVDWWGRVPAAVDDPTPAPTCPPGTVPQCPAPAVTQAIRFHGIYFPRI